MNRQKDNKSQIAKFLKFAKGEVYYLSKLPEEQNFEDTGYTKIIKSITILTIEIFTLLLFFCLDSFHAESGIE